jgi:hypothetical protein
MTEAELETERVALLTEEQALLKEHEGLRLRPDDRHGHAAHYERLTLKAGGRTAFSLILPGLPIGVRHAAQASA